MDRLPVKVELIIGATVILAIILGIYSFDVWGLEKDIGEVVFCCFGYKGESLSISFT